MARMYTLNFNGTFYSTDTILSVYNRGFSYGDSLFESILVHENKVINWEHHFARIIKGAAILGYTFYPWWTKDYFMYEILKTMNENKLDTARVRFNLFREDGGLYRPNNDHAKYLISVQALEREVYSFREGGLKAGLYTDILKPKNQLAGFKNGNSLLYVLASRKAKNEAWDISIILNEDEEICETANGNIFLVRDNQIFTPPLEAGCVAGVMRSNLIQLMEQENWDITEKDLKREELDLADEIWSCNASGGIQYISNCRLRDYKHEWASKAQELLIKQLNNK